MNIIDEDQVDNTISANLNRALIKFPDIKPDVFALLAQPPAAMDHHQSTSHLNSHKSTNKSVCVRRRNRFAHGMPSVSRETHLRSAASTNNVELLQFYLEKGTNPNAADHYNRTALHLAAAQGYMDIINALIQHGADPNVRDRMGNTPLHLASCQGGSGTKGLAIIKVLLQAGTNLDSINSLGNNPLDLAKSKLRILMKTNSSRDHSLAMIITDFQNIVDLMIQYQRMKKANVDDLTSLANRIASLTTSEDVNTEISSLLNDMDSLKL